MHKRILLINPSAGDTAGINEATVHPPLGLAYLASYLKKNAQENKYDIKIIDANIHRYATDKLIDITIRENPDIVGIHLNIILVRNGIEYLKYLKEKAFKARTCIGGPSVSANPELLLELSGADIAVIGEGEQTFLEICEGKAMETIKGIGYWKEKEIVLNESRPFIENIDTIPAPEYKLLPDFDHYKARKRNSRMAPLITSRGCPSRCTFCSRSVFGRRFRAHSADYVLNEIDNLIRNYSINQINILDDNFLLDIKRADMIFEGIIKRNYKIKIDLENGIRTENLTEDFVKKMKKAGVYKVGIGIESADNDVLELIKKDIDLKKIEDSISWFRKTGIITFSFFIIGLPYDKRESINKTIDFAIKANPTFASFSMFLPFPDTDIYRDLIEDRMIESKRHISYESGFFKNQIYHECRFLSRDEVVELFKKAYMKFYLRVSKMIDIITTIRSFGEIKWAIHATILVLKDILLSKRKK